MTKKIITLLLSALFILPVASRADEGLWLPFLIGEQKYKEMKKLGLKLSKDEIYDINQKCVTGAVVGLMSEGSNLRSFGTGSFISPDGLIITNYHVIMRYVESFSKEGRDFIKYGLWSESREQEVFCRGLEIKQLVRMEDVTDQMLEGTEELEGREKQNAVNKNGKRLADEATKGTKYKVRMQQVFGSNQYIMSVYALYKDVRLVAAPPFSIARFGVDKDNYRWPRHSTDFAILRVYADENNQPRAYREENVPYKPEHYLPIASKPAKEGDFIMIAGFPGNTKEYIPSFALDKIIYEQNKIGMFIKQEKSRVIEDAIEKNENLKFRYSTRLSSLENAYLRWKGEYMGVEKMNLVEKKREEEREFQAWVDADPARKAEYGELLRDMEELYKEVSKYNLADFLFKESGLNGSEIVPFIGKFEKLVSMYQSKNPKIKSINNEVKRLIGLTHQFFNNWDYTIDRDIFKSMLYTYYTNVDPYFRSKEMDYYINKYGGDVGKLSDEIFEKSLFASKERTIAFLESEDRDVKEEILNDPLYQLSISFYKVNVQKIARKRQDLQFEQSVLYNNYLKAYMIMNEGKTLYPDANSSLRISYGVVKGLEPEDGVSYHSHTTLEGAIDKNATGEDVYLLPKKIKEYYEAGYNPDICFLTNAHTTSGNSGSPVINAKGELVGLNFDRVWQGLASDFRYNPLLSRSISVDMNYILYLLKNYSRSKYILDELTLN